MKRATLEITDAEGGGPGRGGNHLLMDCVVRWDRTEAAWVAVSDEGTDSEVRVVDERQTRAAVLCLAERAGAGLREAAQEELDRLGAAMRDTERRITTYTAALISVGVTPEQLADAYARTSAASDECNCEAIMGAMGEAKPEHKVAGHEPDCVSTNHIGRWSR